MRPNAQSSIHCRSGRNTRTSPWSRTALALAVGLVMACGFAALAQAQELPNLTPEEQAKLNSLSPEQRQKLQQMMMGQGAGQGNETVTEPTVQTPTVLSPAAFPNRRALKPSAIEDVLSQRAGFTLRQFGYEQVGVGGAVSVPQTGAVQDNYVLGPGDEIDVVLRGQENSEFTANVDRNGQVVLPKTGPVLAAGKTLGDFRRDLLAAIQRAYVTTEAYITVGQLRQVTVMVAGEVANPGMRILTGLSNPLDAILLSGGIKKSGSLRSIQLIRNGQVTDIDLYGLLTRHGDARLGNLQDGDRVYVPPIGSTVAIGGYVRRPAIYELPAGQKSIDAETLLSLGNGPVIRGKYTTSVERILPNGRGQFFDITGEPRAQVRDGEIMILKAAVDISVGRVMLTGAVRTPGAFALDKFKTLHDLLPSIDALMPGAYVLFGFIDRIDPTTLQHQAIPFSPLHVVQGKENLNLITYDSVHIVTPEGMGRILQAGQAAEPQPQTETTPSWVAEVTPPAQLNLPAGIFGPEGSQGAATPGIGAAPVPGQSGAQAPNAAATGGGTPAAGGQPGAVAAGGEAGANENGAGAAEEGEEATGATAAATAAEQGDLSGLTSEEGDFFGRRLSDYRVTFNGAVHKPGTYLVAPNTTLAEMIAVLGGLAEDVDLSQFELTSTLIDNATGVSTTRRQYYPATEARLSEIVVQPYDRVEFRHVYSDRDTGSVSMQGEVRYPGTYTILRGEHLSSVLLRAGGLTEVAYPYGTVFLRKSVAIQEADQNKKTAADIRSQLFDVITRPVGANSQPPTPQAILALQALVMQIEGQPPIGRVSIVADPTILAAHPDRDPILQPDDMIVIPKRPSSVSVLGEVMRPGAFPLDKSMSARDYIGEAGGFTEFADKSRVIIVYPDGRARVDESSWFSLGGAGELPAGTVVVVARDVTGLTFHQLVIDTTQIISQFATTAAALAVLSTNIK